MRRRGIECFDVVNGLVMFLFGVLCLYPFYYVVIYSLSDPQEAAKGLFLFPAGVTLENYASVFGASDILHAAFISVARTVVGTVGTVACSGLFAYGVSKEALPLRRLIYRATVLTMYFGIGLIPLYLTYRAYGWINNFLVYVIPNIVSPFLIVLAKTYFEGIPRELEESAMIDGAGYFRIFARMIVPVSKPILATIAIFQAVYLWNTYYDNLYFTFSNPRLVTLPLVLFNYVSQTGSTALASKTALLQARRTITPTSVRMTITVIVTLPVLAVYPFLQRFFMKGLLIGAVKG
jgi:putative aldouronate transport system permease protein